MEDLDEAALQACEAVEAELNLIHGVLGGGPERPAVLLQLGRLGMAAGLNERAEELLRECTECAPLMPEAWFDRGLACSFLNREEEAVEFLSKALTWQPGLPEGAFRLAQALQGLGRNREALEWYQKVGYESVYCAKARQNEALIALQCGDFEAGWQGYEHRWDENPAMQKRPFESPLWSGGESLAGKSLLLHAEQGLGDTLQFLRYARLCKGLGARLYLEVQAPLKRLVQAGGFSVETLAYGEPLPAHDFHCPLCSLPLAFWRRGVQHIPNAVPYLKSSGDGSDALMLVRAAHRNVRVGVAWQGNPLHPRNRQRSIPSEIFRGLFKAANCSFFGLQMRPEAGPEISAAGGDFTDLSPYIRDFADTASIVQALDLVVCVDTSLAHLSGALGRPAWVLLPLHADWRWGLEGERSEWYPSARLLRQARRGDWGELVERAAAGLERL